MASLQEAIIWLVTFMSSLVTRSLVLKKRLTVWIILMALSSAGTQSMTVSGFGDARGSKKRSRVERNLVLSFASVAALVMHPSIWRQRRISANTWGRCAALSSSVALLLLLSTSEEEDNDAAEDDGISKVGALVTLVRKTMTVLHCLLLSWSVMLVRRWVRRFQYSISVSGPESGVSHRERSVSLR